MSNIEYIQDYLIIRVENGESIPIIAQSLGVSRSSLCDFLRSHPNYLLIKNTKKIGINDYPKIEELYNNNWSMFEIANEFKVCIQTINKILIKIKIKKRGKGRNPNSLSQSINGYALRSYW